TQQFPVPVDQRGRHLIRIFHDAEQRPFDDPARRRELGDPIQHWEPHDLQAYWQLRLLIWRQQMIDATRVDEDEVAHGVRVSEREAPRYVAAHRIAGEREAAEPELLSKLVQEAHLAVEGVVVAGDRAGEAVTRKIERDDAVFGGSRGQLLAGHGLRR